MGKEGIPLAFADASARAVKPSVMRVTAGIPRFSTWTPSWILHAVQEPQLPRPTITRSHFFVSSPMTSSGAGWLPDFFLQIISAG